MNSESMNEKNNIQEELRNLGANRLQEWQKQAASFEPPAGYFESLLENTVQENQLKIKSKRIKLNPFLKYAAAILIGTGLFWWINSTETTTEISHFTVLNWETIDEESMQTYILENIEDFELDLLEELAFEESSTVLEADEISSDAIEEFLEEEEWLEDEIELF